MAEVEQPWDIFAVTLRSALRDSRLRPGEDDDEIAEVNDLGSYPVRNDSKQWACEAILGDHKNQPAWVGLGIEAGTRQTRTQFRELFGLSFHQMQGWFDDYKEGRFTRNPEEIMHAGKPRKIDALAMVGVMKHAQGLVQPGAKKGRTARKRKNLAQMVPVLLRAQAETAERRGATKLEIEAIEPLGTTSIRTYKLEYGMRERLPQPQHEARKKAVSDPFMCIAWVSLMLAFFGQLFGYCKYNIDFSMTKVLPKGGGQRVFCTTEEEAEAEERGERYVLEKDNNEGNGNAIFAKYALMADYVGQLAPLLVIYAVDGMPEEGCFVAKINGLSSSNELGAYGYIMFVPKRAGNKASWKWIHKNFIIKYISENSERNAHLEGGGMRSSVYFDSEHGPLEAAMLPETLALYRLGLGLG
jgi:hypothetical protein